MFFWQHMTQEMQFFKSHIW